MTAIRLHVKHQEVLFHCLLSGTYLYSLSDFFTPFLQVPVPF